MFCIILLKMYLLVLVVVHHKLLWSEQEMQGVKVLNKQLINIWVCSFFVCYNERM